MAALYGGSHDGRKNITLNYGSDNYCFPKKSFLRLLVNEHACTGNRRFAVSYANYKGFVVSYANFCTVLN